MTKGLLPRLLEWIQKQLPGRAVEDRIAWAVANFRFRMSQAVGRMSSGEWSTADFQQFGRQEIKDTLYTVAEIAAGRRLTRKELYEVRRTLKEQIRHWDRFASDIVAKIKALPEKGLEGPELVAAKEKMFRGFERRAHFYHGAIEAEAQKWLLAARWEEGQWFEWDMNPLIENCETCISRDKKRYQMKNGRLPFYPKDGSTICLFNCGCKWKPVRAPLVRKAGTTVTGKKGERST